MAMVTIDARGLKCPVPTLDLTTRMMNHSLAPGDIVDITSDCPTFEENIRAWCQSFRKVLISCRDEGPLKIARIQI